MTTHRPTMSDPVDVLAGARPTAADLDAQFSPERAVALLDRCALPRPNPSRSRAPVPPRRAGGGAGWPLRQWPPPPPQRSPSGRR